MQSLCFSLLFSNSLLSALQCRPVGSRETFEREDVVRVHPSKKQNSTLIVRGIKEAMVKQLAEIMNFMIQHLEQTLQMQVSKEKSTVVANTPSLALAIAERVSKRLTMPRSWAPTW